MKRVFSIVFALVLVVGMGLVTAPPVLADGTIIHVPGDYPTIQDAINAASDGDTIMVAAGEYDAFLVDTRANISIIGAKGATVATTDLYTALPVVGNAWVLAAVYDSEDINIEGIDFDGTSVSGKPVAVGIAYVDSTGGIADLTVENVIATGLGAGVAIIGDVGTSTVQIIGATISNNSAVSEGAGIYVCGGSTLEAHFNNIIGNSEYGLANDGGGRVDATYNWWGDASGPSGFGPGDGDAVSDDVDFEPWLEAEVVTERVTDGTVDAKDEADTEVEVDGTATVTVARYDENPGGPPPTSFSSLVKYTDVYVPDTTEVTGVEIRLYYTAAEVKDFEEQSLRLFWWNDTDWVQCSNSGVNNASGYIWAKITATTTPSLDDLQGTPFGGYGHPTEVDVCFIATAAYGTDTAKELDILREFRDTVLLPNSLGAEFVSFYYKTSPPIAGFISRHEVLRTAVRVGFVDLIVTILNWSHALWSARGP